ncbi:MAG: glycosyltransferase family 39 protein [Acetobacter sp.]|nr:glycosyltransferase family 39 protein [Acetobacter sp.]
MKIEENLNNIPKCISKTAIWLLLAYAMVFAVWTIFFTETGNGDNVEHIHSTWLVAYGKIPYKDFFQHHNPMLWFIFAPFIKFSSDALFLLDMAHAIGILGGILTFYIVYKISTRFFAVSSYSTLLSLLILCPPYFYVFCFNYNPDTYMALCYAAGLYYLFSYWENPKLTSLSFAFTAFFLAFLFTQKILMIYAVLGVISVVVFYKEKTSISDIIFALLLPLCGTLLFVAYLYYYDALELYIESNYLFNVRMQDYYGDGKIDVADYERLICSTILASISILCFFKSSNKYFKIIAILFAVELPLRCFYFAISPYYMLPLMIYIVCLNGVLIEYLSKNSILFIYAILMICFYYAVVSVPRYLQLRGKDRSFSTYISQNTTPCDYVLNSYFANQSITTKDPHYYWSMLGHIDIVGDELGIMPAPNLTELVSQYKPKLVYAEAYWNSYYQHRGQNVLWQIVDPNVIEQYYLPTPFLGLYILKYEYRGKNCHYDTSIKDWIYEN